MGNQLRTLDKEVLEPLASLEILLLDSNQLEDINGNFDNDYHTMQLISGVLSTLPVLKELSITDNSLKWFDMAFFPKSLRVSFLRFSLFFVSQASHSFCRTGFTQDLNPMTKIRIHEKIQSRAWKLLYVLMFAFHILFIMIYPRKG